MFNSIDNNQCSAIIPYTPQGFSFIKEEYEKRLANIKKEIDVDYIPRSIGARKWELVNGNNGEVLPMPNDMEQVLNSQCPRNEGKKIGETHKLRRLPSGTSLRDLLDIHGHEKSHAIKMVEILPKEEKAEFSIDSVSILKMCVNASLQAAHDKNDNLKKISNFIEPMKWVD